MSNSDQDILLPPLLPITPNDNSGYVVVTSVLLIILTLLVVGVAFVSRTKIVGRLLMSDWLLFLATIIFLVEGVCMRYACLNGLGRHRNALSGASFEQYSKHLYASQILAHVSLTCTKLSMVVLIISIKPFHKFLLACYGVLGFIYLWGIIGVFTLSFQCDRPRPWDFTPGRCLNQQALHVSLGVGSIIIDVATVILPCFIVWRVQLSFKKRMTVAALFGTRIFVAVFTAISLAKIQPFFKSNPTDQPWHAVTPSIWLQVNLCLSIVTASIPGLKRVLADLRTGLMAGAVPEFYELSVSGGAGESYTSGTHSGSSNPRTGVKREHPCENLLHFANDDSRIGKYASYGHNSKINNPRKPKDRRKTGLMSRGNNEPRSPSAENLTDNGIIQTREYEVRYESSRDEGKRAKLLASQ
ncbi:hypothetical protein D8B26_005619 [Coccidioides posadasii str. Silveira]|uniref:uncharacterized protein n=1 Tax=Coccidioides posadasii (strain RMSCC 757 / Silveira) TaxID=443226 RepID=UPI001BEE2EE7|nr:hypothetical protein D8B26_005619 [Coccidioides posadasii str. Silveira]